MYPFKVITSLKGKTTQKTREMATCTIKHEMEGRREERNKASWLALGVTPFTLFCPKTTGMYPF